MPCPTLARICLEVLAWSPEPVWALQKRRMQLLPEHASKTLAQLLLQFNRLHAPSQLDAFRDCLTALHITPGSGIHLDAEWLAHIGSLRQLQSLTIRGLPKLRDKALGPLASAAGRLLHLDLTGCSGVTSKSLTVLAQLTSLHSLVLSGTTIRSPVLGALTSLSHLTRLHLGGWEVTDADIIQQITAFTALQDLDLWGCAAGDTSARHISHSLPALTKLSLAWSQITCSLPLAPGLTWLDLSHCKLRGPYDDADFVAATEVQHLRVLVLAQVEMDAMGCELLEVLIRASASHLEVLDLSHASLHNQLPLLLALEGASQLSALSLSGTQLVDDYLPTVAACTSLRTLNLSQNPGITAAGLGAALPGFAAQLLRLDLHGTGVSNAVLPLLKHLPQLQQLVLADTAISWESKAARASEADAGAAQEEVAAPMQAPVAAPQVVDHLVGLPDWRAAHATGAPVSQHRSSEQPAAGWPKLQMLDMTGTQLTGAGCAELAAELAAAGSSAAEGGSCGLRVLHVGSSSHKLGRKALLAVTRLTTLQQLTLQGWGLVGRDMRHLQPLQQLQHLHVEAADPWLLEDSALLQLTDDMPVLSSITRDGRQLLHDFRASAAAPAGAAEPGSHATQQASGWAGLYGGDSTAAAATSGSSCSSIWAAGPLPGELDQQQHEVSVLSPWLQRRVQQPLAQGHISGVRVQKSSAKHPGSMQQGRSPRHIAGAHAGGSSTTMYQRLSAYDERFRYTSEELLVLRSHLGSEQQLQPATVGTAAASTSSAGGHAGQGSLVEILPLEIRSGATW